MSQDQFLYLEMVGKNQKNNISKSDTVICLCILSGYLPATVTELSSSTETVRPTEPKIFIIVPFMEKNLPMAILVTPDTVELHN